MKKISLVTALVGLVSALVALFHSVFGEEGVTSRTGVEAVSVSGKGNQVGSNTTNIASHNIFLGGSQITNFIRPDPDIADAAPPRSELVGTWRSRSRQRSLEGDVIVDGYLRFHPNGTYSFSGSLAVHSQGEAHAADATMTTLAAGTWQSGASGFSITLGDLKTQKAVFRGVDGRDIHLDPLAGKLLAIPDYRPEAILPRGSTQDYAITELTTTYLRATGKDIRGMPVELTAIRQL